MPFELAGGADRNPFRIAASAPCEMLWVLLYLLRGQPVPDIPALKPVRDRNDALSKRVRAFWKGSTTDFIEILVLAAHSGTLETPDAEPFLESLTSAATIPLANLSLPSETPKDRATIHERLRQLSGSRELRRTYRELLQTLWSLLKPGWQRDGRPVVERAMAAWQREADSGRQLPELLFPGHIYFQCTAVVNLLETGVASVLTPSFFASRGGHVVILPNLVHVAAGVGPEDVSEAVRQQANALSKQLRVLADPTRLAILLHLTEAAHTVGEMAARFQVTQPTVSGHIKALRDGGLVEARRSGQRVPYAANRQRIADLLREAEQALMVDRRQFQSSSSRRQSRKEDGGSRGGRKRTQ